MRKTAPEENTGYVRSGFGGIKGANVSGESMEPSDPARVRGIFSDMEAPSRQHDKPSKPSGKVFAHGMKDRTHCVCGFAGKTANEFDEHYAGSSSSAGSSSAGGSTAASGSSGATGHGVSGYKHPWSGQKKSSSSY